jgi:hypothetical protein
VLFAVNYLLARTESEPAAVKPLATPLGEVEKTLPGLASFITEQAPADPAIMSEKDLSSETAGSEPSNNQACYEGGELAALQVSNPIKAANKVYFSSASPQTVCISDANHHLQRFRLNDSKGYVFRGEPPFIVSAENFSSLALFFQGKKVSLGDTASGAVKLSANLP